jgi:uncharacterized membrane protein (UPF0127 family)
MITNLTRKSVLAGEVEIASSFFSKARGLMFRSGLAEDGAMLFPFREEARTGIWMLFMRFPIDLVYVNSKGRVVGIFEHIRPVSLNPKTWKVYYPPEPARYVVELASGTVRRTGTRIGDVLNFAQFKNVTIKEMK